VPRPFALHAQWDPSMDEGPDLPQLSRPHAYRGTVYAAAAKNLRTMVMDKKPAEINNCSDSDIDVEEAEEEEEDKDGLVPWIAKRGSRYSAFEEDLVSFQDVRASGWKARRLAGCLRLHRLRHDHAECSLRGHGDGLHGEVP